MATVLETPVIVPTAEEVGMKRKADVVEDNPAATCFVGGLPYVVRIPVDFLPVLI